MTAWTVQRLGTRRRPGHVTRRLMLLAVALTACGVGPSPTSIGPSDAPGPSAPELAAGEVRGDRLTMRVTAQPAVVAAGEPIEVQATLVHAGPGPLVVSGSGSGIVSFSVTRLSDGLSSGPPAWTDDCAIHELPAGEEIVVPFSKSGGWSEDDEHADFLRTYFSDPELSLPPGTWRIDVATHGTRGEGCRGPQLELEMSLIVTVTE